MKRDELYLWFLADPESPRQIGQLSLVDAGKGVSLTYGAEWLEGGFPLSEDLPLTDIEQLPRWRGMAVGAVDDARPDRWGERVIQFLDKPARLSLMEYLYYAGDDRFGALGVSTSQTAYVPRPSRALPRLDQAQELSQIVHKVSAKAPVTALERQLLAAGGSFGGAKPKALLDIAGVEWIIKFFDGEPTDVPLIEHASMTLAARAGIRAAQTRRVALNGENAVAVRRYDRDGQRRVHCISAGTALRAETPTGEDPVFGYPSLAQILRRAGVTAGGEDLRDRQELFRRMVFNILIDNTDDHEKNHALMVVAPLRQGRYRLAPAYDVVPTNSGQGHQEFVVGAQGRDSTLENAMSQCELFGYEPREAAAAVVRVIAVVDGWQQHFAAAGVTAADLASLAEQIDGARLRAERRRFNPNAFPRARIRRPRSPFAR